MFKNILLSLAAVLAIGAAGCGPYDQSFSLQVLGNVFDQDGLPISGLTGSFCWTLTYSEGDPDTGCQPVSTNGEGQFSTMVAGVTPTANGPVQSVLQAYTSYIEVDGVKYSGKEVVHNVEDRSATSDYDGTIVINYTVPQN